MSSSLDSVLTVRRHTLEQRQAALAAAVQADRQLEEAQATRDADRVAATAEAAARSQSGPVDVAAVSARLLYAQQLQAQRRALQAQRDQVAEQIAICRRAVAKADADVRAIERLLEKRAAEAAKQRAKREQIAMEEAFAAGRSVDASSLMSQAVPKTPR